MINKLIKPFIIILLMMFLGCSMWAIHTIVEFDPMKNGIPNYSTQDFEELSISSIWCIVSGWLLCVGIVIKRKME